MNGVGVEVFGEEPRRLACLFSIADAGVQIHGGTEPLEDETMVFTLGNELSEGRKEDRAVNAEPIRHSS
jgi:hypothetical protein